MGMSEGVHPSQPELPMKKRPLLAFAFVLTGLAACAGDETTSDATDNATDNASAPSTPVDAESAPE